MCIHNENPQFWKPEMYMYVGYNNMDEFMCIVGSIYLYILLVNDFMNILPFV